MKFGKKKAPEADIDGNGSGSKTKTKKKKIVLQSPNLYVGGAAFLAGAMVAVVVFAYHLLVILPAQQEAKNDIVDAQLQAVKLVFSDKLLGLQRLVAHYAEGIPEPTYHASEPTRSLQAELALTSMPGALRALIAPAGQATRDKKPPLPVSFASLDLIRSVEVSQQTGLDAFAFQDQWYVQVVAPRVDERNQITGTLLVMFDAAVLRPDWSGLPNGDIQLLQAVGDKMQPVIVRGSPNPLDMITQTSLAQWSVGYSPKLDSPGYTDHIKLIVAIAAGGLLAAVLVAFSVILLLRKTRTDIGFTTAYVEAVLQGTPALQPKIQLSLMGDMVAVVSTHLQRVTRSKSTGDAASAAAGKEARPAVQRDETGKDDFTDSELRGTEQHPEVAKELPAEELNSELEDAEPLFQGDSLDIDMLDDDDLLDLNNEDLGLDQASADDTDQINPEDIAEQIFRVHDIRGVYGETINNAVMVHLGKALGSEAINRGAQSICVGIDGRDSSAALAQSLMRGLVSTGLKVINLGRVPLPLLYFAIDHLQLEAGAMVTGGNHPSAYNGLKIVINGETPAQADIQQLQARVRSADYTIGQGELTAAEVADDYVDSIVADIAVATPLKVVVDAGHGVTGELAPNLLTELGCEVIPLHCEIGDSFDVHQPDPSQPENLQDLIAKVLESEADIGIALDGDGDQLGVVTNTGSIVWPDRLLMLFAKDVVSRNPGADVVFDVDCSRRLGGLVSGFGGRPVMWRSGPALLRAKMKETGALLGGEMSGHIFFKERWSGFDDGLYGAARLLEILGIEDRDVQSVFDEFPEDFSTPKLHVGVADVSRSQILRQLEEQANWGDATISSIDGLRIDYSDGWGLCRISNTESTLVFRFEAETEEALQRIQHKFREQLLAVNADLNLPF